MRHVHPETHPERQTVSSMDFPLGEQTPLQNPEIRRGPIAVVDHGTLVALGGVVQNIDGQSWLISDIKVTVDENTIYDEGLGQGDRVQVKGLILDVEWEDITCHCQQFRNKVYNFLLDRHVIDTYKLYVKHFCKRVVNLLLGAPPLSEKNLTKKSVALLLKP